MSPSGKRIGSAGPEPDPVARARAGRAARRARAPRRREEVGRGRQRELLAPQRRLVLAGELRVELLERLVHAGGVVDVRDRAGRAGSRGACARPPAWKPGRSASIPKNGVPCVDRVEHLAHPRGGPVHALGRLADGGLRRLLARRREERLARRAEQHLRDLVLAPLRLRVEGAAALDLVAEELEPHRRRVGGAPQVHDPAAHREGAGVLDERHAGEAEQRRASRRAPRGRSRRPCRGGPSRASNTARGTWRRARPRAETTTTRARSGGEVEPGERGEPLQLDAAVRGEVVVGEHRVGGDAQHRVRRRGRRRRRARAASASSSSAATARTARARPAPGEDELAQERARARRRRGRSRRRAAPPRGRGGRAPRARRWRSLRRWASGRFGPGRMLVAPLAGAGRGERARPGRAAAVSASRRRRERGPGSRATFAAPAPTRSSEPPEGTSPRLRRCSPRRSSTRPATRSTA